MPQMVIKILCGYFSEKENYCMDGLLARLDEVQEELLNYPWRWRRQRLWR